MGRFFEFAGNQTPPVSARLLRYRNKRVHKDDTPCDRGSLLRLFRSCYNRFMTDWRATFERVMSGNSDASIRFNDLCQMLRAVGFTERTSGSHHLFSRSGVREMINLQRDGSQAKSYQVRQVRKVLKQHRISGEGVS